MKTVFMRPMSPTATTTSTTRVMTRAVPIRNRINRFSSGWLGRRSNTPAQAASGRASQAICTPLKSRKTTAANSTASMPSISSAYGRNLPNADTGVTAIHSRVSQASQKKMMNRNRPQCVRYDQMGVCCPVHGMTEP